MKTNKIIAYITVALMILATTPIVKHTAFPGGGGRFGNRESSETNCGSNNAPAQRNDGPRGGAAHAQTGMTDLEAEPAPGPRNEGPEVDSNPGPRNDGP